MPTCTTAIVCGATSFAAYQLSANMGRDNPRDNKCPCQRRDTCSRENIRVRLKKREKEGKTFTSQSRCMLHLTFSHANCRDLRFCERDKLRDAPQPSLFQCAFHYRFFGSRLVFTPASNYMRRDARCIRSQGTHRRTWATWPPLLRDSGYRARNGRAPRSGSFAILSEIFPRVSAT